MLFSQKSGILPWILTKSDSGFTMSSFQYHAICPWQSQALALAPACLWCNSVWITTWEKNYLDLLFDYLDLKTNFQPCMETFVCPSVEVLSKHVVKSWRLKVHANCAFQLKTESSFSLWKHSEIHCYGKTSLSLKCLSRFVTKHVCGQFSQDLSSQIFKTGASSAFLDKCVSACHKRDFPQVHPALLWLQLVTAASCPFTFISASIISTVDTLLEDCC